MTVEKIPFPYTFDDCNPRYRLLNQINSMFKKNSEPFSVPPLFKLISILKEKCCTSCSLRTLDDTSGHSDTINAILSDMKALKMGSGDQDYITGYHSSTDETFLALNLPNGMAHEVVDSFVLIMWRKGRIFTPEDVIIARTCVILFFSLCKEFLSVYKPQTAPMNTSEILARASQMPEDLINSNTLTLLYEEALDLVCKCVIITNKDGALIHMNKCAEAVFKRSFSNEEMTQNFSGGIDWFAGLLHPDDLQNLVDTWNSAKTSTEGFTIEFRLQGGENKLEYHLYRCLSRPIQDKVNGTIQYWIFCMFDMEQSRLMEETKLAAGRKTKFLAEMSHGKRENFSERLFKIVFRNQNSACLCYRNLLTFALHSAD